jgi:hypothetical protein
MRQRSAQFGPPTCEACLNIDLAWLRRRGMLQPGRFSTLTWSQFGEKIGSITLAAQSGGVRLVYRTKDRDGAPIEVNNELVIFVYLLPPAGRQRLIAALIRGARIPGACGRQSLAKTRQRPLRSQSSA